MGETQQPVAIPAAALHLGPYQAAVDAKLAEFNAKNFTAGFWQKQADLWVQDAQAQAELRAFMGWLRVAETMQQAVPEINAFVQEVKAAGFTHVIVMGMGGSSMAPIVFEKSFPKSAEGLEMLVLDTTDPGTVQQIEKAVPLATTLCIVASKSGTTAEPLAFGDYFYDRIKAIKGDKAGENFVAITDPGSKFIATAESLGYRRVFLNFTEVGGRFSALSYFGLVPAALYGIDIEELLRRAVGMMAANGASGDVAHNPGLELGVTLGVLAQQGRDKLTLITPPSLSDLGLWLEQLIAESTGKHGVGILPVAGEPLADASLYGSDRVFVYVGYEGQPDEENQEQLQALQAAGHPVISILMHDALDLGQEFFRWEVATAVASAVLEINPFDQPNVQAAKTATDKLMKEVAEKGSLPQEEKTLAADGLSYYGGSAATDAKALLSSFFQAQPGDYVSIQAYLTETPELNAAIAELRATLQQRLHAATTFGYGPRFLHSTGQYHKGGPNTGLFLQLTADNNPDLPLPGRSYTFGTLKNAQAQGDLEALRSYDRRTLRVDLGANALEGVKKLTAALK
ncbi:glucose-6-phosphate isomerase [Hymenobacter jeollabukensis]|uniref:Glucose-6-phosphate isomerase n=1 Tax=Hymenobacter jeollabukensis TaxID=2025313 RepID=A0A5R8WN39_9BACT|nr:glucose-6-phosphate isomerase [Hymenobacter jeollabukensis]TLM91125.1 glucose-6-phosphate isomerase [Hymenobacter jeollabukensis]